MPSKSYTKDEIVRYLFAEMPEAECEALEDAVFDDGKLFAVVAETENGLIDDYVRGLLPMRERQRFEQNYLTHPARLRRVQNAQAMLARFDQVATARLPANRLVDREAEKKSWWRRFLENWRSQRLIALPAALAILLVAVCGLWTWNEIQQLRNQVANLQTAQLLAEQRMREALRQASQNNSSTPADLPPATIPTPSTTNLTIATLLLTADSFRSSSGLPTGKTPLLTITPDTQQVRLILKNSVTDYRSYQAEIQNASGETILSLPKLSHQKSRTASTFTATAPTDKLNTGTYFLVIKGVTGTGEVDRVSNAEFRVEKK